MANGAEREMPSSTDPEAEPPRNVHVQFRGIYKLFGDSVAVEDLNLEIYQGEFLVLVGPSGCGKTTSLRMLGGLEQPTFGEIVVRGKTVNRLPPKARNMAMVFQSYALYPHMTVRGNLAFGMKARRESRKHIVQRVEEVAKTLGLEQLLDRRPEQLSGGQRQRVALGRALIREPEVFLLDEPLSNLDAALRVQMRAELQELHKRLRVTTVYVTHDQVEAMTMGTRIALLHEGRLQQVDHPEAIYERPANLFVAGFIGSPRMNLCPGRISSRDGASAVEALGTSFPLSGQLASALSAGTERVTVGIRPEDLRWTAVPSGDAAVTVAGVVEIVEPLGAETLVTVAVAGERLLSRFPPRSGVAPGDTVELRTDPSYLHLFDAESGTRVPTRPVAEPVTTAGPAIE